jgi:hypothetical protein
MAPRAHITDRPTRVWAPLVIASAAFASVLSYWYGLGFRIFRSDVASYWRDSLAWREPFGVVHMPGYPLAIAAVRGVTCDVLTPVTLMATINLVALVAGTYGTLRLASQLGLSDRTAVAAAVAFALWPCVGITYSAFPLADMPAMAVVIWGAVLLLDERGIAAGCSLGLAAITHKGLWPAVGLLLVGALTSPDRRRLAVRCSLTALFPFGALWVGGVVHGEPASWPVARSISLEAEPDSSLPLLDGLIGSILYGGAAGLLRAGMAMAATLGAGLLFSHYVRHWRDPGQQVLATLSAQVVFLGLTLNQNAIFATVRFSGLLSVPLAYSLGGRLDGIGAREWRRIAGAGIAVLAVSQLAYAWYSARVYY